MIENLDVETDCVIISVNAKIYPIESVYFAAYMFIEDNYVILSGDPSEEVLVEIRPKSSKPDLEILGREFNNELISYAAYVTQSKRTLPLRHLIMQKAFLSNIGEDMPDMTHDMQASKEACECETAATDLEEASVYGYEDDPADISLSWEDAHKDEDNEKK